MASNKNLLILGAGQYGQVAKETAELMGKFETITLLDELVDEANYKNKTC